RGPPATHWIPMGSRPGASPIRNRSRPLEHPYPRSAREPGQSKQTVRPPLVTVASWHLVLSRSVDFTTPSAHLRPVGTKLRRFRDPVSGVITRVLTGVVTYPSSPTFSRGNSR